MSVVYTPTGLVTHASLTLPSDGDPAVAASVNAAGFQYLADNTAWLLLQGSNVYNVRNYGAVGDGVTDDRPAFLAAMAAAAGGFAGGIVYVPAGRFFLSNGFAWDGSVSMIGDGFESTLLLGHASANFFNISVGGSNAHTAIRIANLCLGATVSNSGTIFVSGGSSSNLIVSNVLVNGGYVSNLDGRIYENASDFNTTTFVDCRITCRSSGLAFNLASDVATLNMFGNLIRMPATFATALVRLVGKGVIVGNQFDLSAHASGADPVAIQVSSAGSKPAVITGNTFFSAASGPTKYALSWILNAAVFASGNAYYAVNRFYPALQQLLSGSYVELLPTNKVSLTGNAYTLSDGIRSQSVRFGPTSPSPTITLPAIMFPGQVIDITIWNASGNTWGFSVANYGFKSTQPTLGTNTGATATFVAGDPTVLGSFSWVQVGEWAEIAP